MEAVLAWVAAGAAGLFVADLVRAHRARPRPHVAAWAAAMTMYTVGTAALAVGLSAGWSGPVFRTFYAFGAIINVPFLALGSLHLVVGAGPAGRIRDLLIVFAPIALLIVFSAPFVADLPDKGVPEGSQVFASIGSVGPTGPRLWAVISNVFGTVLLVGLAGYSVLRLRKTNRRLVAGNLLIVAGVLAPAFGGTLVALGEGTALALSLLVGAVLLWAGYRVASAARRG